MGKVNAPLKVIAPPLVPFIHVVLFEPSQPAISNCLLPVAVSTSTVPITTFPDPDVIFSPASCPIPML